LFPTQNFKNKNKGLLKLDIVRISKFKLEKSPIIIILKLFKQYTMLVGVIWKYLKKGHLIKIKHSTIKWKKWKNYKNMIHSRLNSHENLIQQEKI